MTYRTWLPHCCHCSHPATGPAPQGASCLPSCPGSLENGPFSLHPANNCPGFIFLWLLRLLSRFHTAPLGPHHVHAHFCDCTQFLRGSLGRGGCVYHFCLWSQHPVHTVDTCCTQQVLSNWYPALSNWCFQMAAEGHPLPQGNQYLGPN